MGAREHPIDSIVKNAIHASSVSNEQTKRMGARDLTFLPMNRSRCDNISSASEEQTKRMVLTSNTSIQHIDTMFHTRCMHRVHQTNQRWHGVFERKRFLQWAANDTRTCSVHAADTSKRMRAREQHVETTCGTRIMHQMHQTRNSRKCVLENEQVFQ